MLHPASLWRILAGGLILTFRDVVTERLFGLDWTGMPRYVTGVPVERVGADTRRALRRPGDGATLPGAADGEHVHHPHPGRARTPSCRQLGAFGDPDRQYLRPRFVRSAA